MFLKSLPVFIPEPLIVRHPVPYGPELRSNWRRDLNFWDEPSCSVASDPYPLVLNNLVDNIRRGIFNLHDPPPRPRATCQRGSSFNGGAEEAIHQPISTSAAT